jgi:WXG100 family type VII secretion target
VDDLVVDFASLQPLASGIDNRIEQISELLDDLQSKIDTLTAQWIGASSDAFRHAHANWLAAAEDLRTRLTGIRDLVRTAHNNHASAVHTNVGMWRV